MSGHNKWSKIKHQKATADAQKSKVFSRFAQQITLEVKKAGGDGNAPGVRAVIERAKAANMPLVNIERAVTRGAGKDAESLEAVAYEAYGPGGSALIIAGITDNRNRTAAEIKHLLSKQGSSLAEPGAASWAFEKQNDGTWAPKTTIPLSGNDAEKLKTLTESLEEHDDVQAVYTNLGS